jgi:hypothetical protein
MWWTHGPWSKGSVTTGAGALKYIMRMGSKDQDPQEIEKGKHYMEKLLEVLNER